MASDHESLHDYYRALHTHSDPVPAMTESKKQLHRILNALALELPRDLWARVNDSVQAAAQGMVDEAFAAERAACAPYLKDGETPVQCIKRNRTDIDALMGLLAAEKRKNETLETERTACAAIAREVKSHYYTGEGAVAARWIAEAIEARGERPTAAICGARHQETGATCELESGHVQNHRGAFRYGITQWPGDRPTGEGA
jgi:hypothetical protein